MTDDPAVVKELATLFTRNGYVRRQNLERKAAEGHRRYEKGDEIRLTASSDAELARIRGLLQVAGFTIGRPYRQGEHQYRQPLYGRQQVARFLELVGQLQATEQAPGAVRPEA